MNHTLGTVIDADKCFLIDPITKTITNQTSEKNTLIQYEHNSEVFTFKIPRIVEGHDMLECDKVQIHFDNEGQSSTNHGLYESEDASVVVENDTEYLVFSWLISQEATKFTGKINFQIKFVCYREDDPTVLDYNWSSKLFAAINVLPGINNADIIVEENADVLAMWERKLFGLSEEGVENINTAKAAAIEEVENAGKRVADSLPDDYVEMTEKVKNITNALKGTASGEAIGLNDVSPIEHTVAVKVKSKNIISIADKTISGDKGFTSGTINIIPLTPNTVYTVSADFAQTGSKATVGITVRDSSGTTIGRSDTTTDTNGRLSATFAVPTDGKIVIVLFSNIDATAITGTSCSYSNFQIEEGTTATPYAPFVADVSVAKVKKCGKNIIPYPFTDTTKVHSGITFTDNGDGSITVNGTATSNAIFYFWHSQEGLCDGVYSLSGNINNLGGMYCRAYQSSQYIGIDGVDTGNGVANRKVTGKYDDGVCLFYKIQSGTKVENLTIRPQLELNPAITEYEPYKEPVTYAPNADGTVEGVTSLYPSTTLLTDTEGVVIDCGYNRDINKAFEELTQAIISLGGNV